MKKKLKGKITISRNNHDEINVKIEDSNSDIEFVEFTLDLESYGRLLTGQGYISGYLSVRNLEYVGKIRESKPLVFEVPNENKYGASDWAEKNAQNFADEGWIADTYFRSQTSIKAQGEKTIARTVQYRYVDKE